MALKIPTIQHKSICDAYLGGQSSIELGKQLNVDPSTIRQILRKNKIPLRKTKYDYSDIRIGFKLNHLTVISDIFTKDGFLQLEVECDCLDKNILQVRAIDFITQSKKSCGCLRKLNYSVKSINYPDKSVRKIYLAWASMKQRCYNPDSDNFTNYGERGIRICEEWFEDVEKFIKWSEENGHEDHLSIDRIDVNGNYSPENCRWTSVEVQNRNKRTNAIFEAFGEKKCFKDWSKDERCVVSNGALYKRVYIKNMDIEKALTTPPNKDKQHNKKSKRKINE